MTIGVDITEVKRIKELALRHDQFLRRVYTAKERAYCQRKRNKYQHLAARFAAKESVLKAIGTGWSGQIAWTDIEIVNTKSGMPVVRTHGAVKKLVEKRKVKEIVVSLSHCSDYAIASAQLVF
jgi:holo-[acyl-carrier protein] synthase